MPRTKVIDIRPPQLEVPEPLSEDRGEGELTQETPRRVSRRGVWKVTGVVVSFSVLALAVLFHTVFARATVEVWPQVKETALTQRVSVGGQGLAGEVFEAAAEDTRLFEATGAAESSSRASGTIRVYNENSTSPQTLVANTRFVSQDGALFRSQERITIPGGVWEGGELKPGTLDIAVSAAEPGPEYNIGPSTFSLPGLAGSALFTKVYAKSFERMKGGELGEARVVTAQDIERAAERMAQDLEARAKDRIIQDLPPGFVVPDGGFVAEQLDGGALVKEGAELSQFNYAGGVNVKGVGYKEEELYELAVSQLSTQVEEHERLQEDTLAFEVSVLNVDAEAGTMELSVDMRASFVATLDAARLSAMVAGTTPFGAETILKGTKGLAESSVSLWPFWLTNIPDDEGKIQVKVNGN